MSDRAPTWDPDAEENALGAMLSTPAAADRGVRELRDDDFYRDTERRIFAAIKALRRDSRPVDPVTVGAEMRADPQLRSRLHSLCDVCYEASHIGAYIAAVRASASDRRLHTAIAAMQAKAETNGTPPEDLHRYCLEQLAEATPVAGGGPRSTIVCAADIDGADAGEVEWLAEGFVAAGNLTGVTAPPKAGKTTLALELARALTGGQPFLEHRTVKTGVLYLTEQSPSSFANQLGRAGLLGSPNLHIMYRSATRRWDWPAIMADAVAHAETAGLRVLIVDTLGDWTVLPVEGGENDAGRALQALQPLRDATAAHGLGVVVLRHARKGASNPVEEARGSSAYPGGLDIVLSLRKVGGVGRTRQRLLIDAGSRPEGVPAELAIELEETGEYRVLGDAAAAAQQDARRQILAELTDDFEQALTEREIIALCEPAKPSTLRLVLMRLVDDGLVLRGKGAGSASARSFGYWQARALP